MSEVIIVIIGVFVIFFVTMFFAEVLAQSVYDLGIDGELVKQCFKQPSSYMVYVAASDKCFPITDFFLQHGFKHTGEIIGSNWQFGAREGYDVQTNYLVLSK